MTLDSERKEWKELLLQTLMELREDDFEEFKFFSDLPQRVREHADRVVIADELMKKHGKNALKQTVKILEKMGNLNLAEMLLNDMLEITGAVFSVHDDDQITRLKADLQDNLRSLYSFVPEGNTEPWKQQQPLAEVYTEVDITYGADVTPNDWHEVLQMETRAAAAAKESILSCDIFKSPDGKPRPIRTLLTVGFAGIGKTFLVQKFVCDWASGNANQDVHFIFPFTFRELNTDKGKSFTLAELIRRYVYESRHMSEETLNNIFAELQMSGKQDYESSGIKILFVLDGLDECNFKMDLKNQMKVDIDVKKPYPLEVLLGHLIKRNLLPCSRVWITTRPATARDIRADLIDSRTVVRGFSDSRRLEYFSKRFPYEERVIEHIQKSRTIFIMCHIPIFCWLTATVLQDHLDKGKGELPTTLTDLYSAFLGYLLENSKERNTTEHIPYVKALAKLAFDHTMNNCQVFYEKDLADSGFDYGQAAKHSGIFTEVFQEVPPLSRSKQKTFQFIHLTIQEYLAALYVMMSLFHNNKNVLNDSGLSLGNSYLTQTTITDVHKSALKKASESKGHLDLFLRFLIGLSLPCNQELLGELLKAPQGRGQTKSKTVKLIKERIKQNTPEKNINLFYCLKELKDDSLLKQFHKKNRLDDINWNDMPNDMWSALAFFLLTDNKTIKSFKLSLYAPSPMGLQKLLVVVKASQESILGDCHLDKGSCHLLASVLSSPSNLRHLDLSRNDLSDEGVEILSKGLASPNCILEFLDLRECGLDKGSCHLLASVLSSPSNLRHLDLSSNKLSDEGVEILSKGLASPNCILESLDLEHCWITSKGCVSLAEALKVTPSHLQELDLDSNNLSDEGVEILSKGLASPNCILKVLKLSWCRITSKGCVSLAEALKVTPSHLQELDLTRNNVSDDGVEILSKGLASPHCILQILNLEHCGITSKGCVSLAEALRLNPSHLQELDLTRNDLLDEGVEILSKGLASPHCILKVLKLEECKITQQGCVSLAEALKVTPSHLQELHLSENNLSDEGVEILSKGLASPHCILKILKLSWCSITKKGYVSLAEALKVNPSHLQELDLSRNDLSDEGVEILSKGLASPHCILKVLKLSWCSITQRGCISLAEALKVTTSHLQELDLSYTYLPDEGVEILSKGLASPHCILKILKLSWCGIADTGCISLAKALKLNPSHLQELNLGANRIEKEGKRVLLEIKEDPSYSLKTVEFND
nr:NACHT, LRR and PYD domains-containing protein 3-like [Nerophis lumbriciformis]